MLFELSRPDPAAHRPLFTDFAPRLLISHPAEVRGAHAPLLTLLTELLTEADEAGKLRTGVNPRRAAALTMQTVMFVAQSAVVSDHDDLPGAHRRRGMGLLRQGLRHHLSATGERYGRAACGRIRPPRLARSRQGVVPQCQGLVGLADRLFADGHDACPEGGGRGLPGDGA